MNTGAGAGAGAFPIYNYADEIMSPREIGIKRDGSFDGIMRAVAGVNYYADTIGFGESTVFAKEMGMKQSPLGLRFFTPTGATCSNGAKMWEYVDTIPNGMGGRVGQEVQAMGLPNLKGLGPGIMEDAATSLNPVPLLDAMVRGGYAQCKQMTAPVGDAQGRLASRYNPKTPWITGATQDMGGKPHQTKWVFDKWISHDEYQATPKTAGGLFDGFQNKTETETDAAKRSTFSIKSSQAGAVILLGTLACALMLTTGFRFPLRK